MSNSALKAISITIGIFFIFFGILKIGVIFSEQLYRDMRKVFIRYATVFPFHTWTGWTPDAHTIRRVYGATEIISGLVMACSRGLLCDLSNCLLIGLIVYSLYSNWALDEGLKEASHSIVLGLVLACRFVIRLQTLQKTDESSNADDDEAVKVALQRELKKRMRELQKTMLQAEGLFDPKHSCCAHHHSNGQNEPCAHDNPTIPEADTEQKKNK